MALSITVDSAVLERLFGCASTVAAALLWELRHVLGDRRPKLHPGRGAATGKVVTTELVKVCGYTITRYICKRQYYRTPDTILLCFLARLSSLLIAILNLNTVKFQM